MTNIDGVFAGGDVVQNKATVCMAVNNGKKASEKISNYCLNNQIIQNYKGENFEETYKNFSNYNNTSSII